MGPTGPMGIPSQPTYHIQRNAQGGNVTLYSTSLHCFLPECHRTRETPGAVISPFSVGHPKA